MHPVHPSPSMQGNISGEYQFSSHKVMFGELYGEALKPIHCVNNRIHMRLQCQHYRDHGLTPEAYTLSVGHNDVQQILVYFGRVPSFIAIETSVRFAEVASQRVGGEEILAPGSPDPKKRYIILALTSAFKLDTEASLELSQLLACIRPWTKVKILKLEAARKLIADANLDVVQKEVCYNKRTKPDGLTETILVYQPTWKPGDIPVTSDDVASLAEGTYLNEIIINFYLKYLYDNILTAIQRQKTHMFNSYFYKRLMKKQGKKFSPSQMHGMVKRWTQNVDIFEKDFLVIPVNEHSHWYVAVICFPGKASSMYLENLSEKVHAEKEDEVADFVKETKSFDIECESKSCSETAPLISVGNDSCSLSPTTPNTPTSSNMSDIVISTKTNDSNSSTEKQLDFVAQCSYKSVSEGNTDELSGSSVCKTPKTLTDFVTQCSYKSVSEGNTDELSGSSVCKTQKTITDFVTQSSYKSVTEGNTDELSGSSVCKTPKTITENSNDGAISSSSAKEKDVEKQAGCSERFIQPCILIFDSSSKTSHPQVFTNLRHYLTQEWALRKPNRSAGVFDKLSMKGNHPKIPRQINNCDCGVFLLQNVESFFTHCIKTFTFPIHLETWFTPEYVSKKREHISDVITKLAASSCKGKRHNKGDEHEMPKRNRSSSEL